MSQADPIEFNFVRTGSWALIFIVIILITSGCRARPERTLKIPAYAVNTDLERRIASHTYPKLSNQLQLCCRTTSDEALLEKVSLWDIAIVDVEIVPNMPEYLGATGKIRTKNPNAVLLGYFSAGDVNLHYTQPIHEGYNRSFSEQWFLYDVARKPVPLYRLGGKQWTLAQNPTTPVNQYLPDYLNRFILNTNLVDGIFYDWAITSISWLNHRNPPQNDRIDIDNDHKADSDKKVDEFWRRGFSQILENSRSVFPAGTLIVGNGGWNTGAEYSPYVNGIMIEQFLEGNRHGNQSYGWTALMRTYSYHQKYSPAPRLSIIMANDDNPHNFRAMRFALASTLLFDGYFAFTNRYGAYRSCQWYDEYAVNLQSGKAEQDLQYRGYLGRPMGTAFRASKPSEILEEQLRKEDAQEKVWRRDFENGIVLVNPSDSARTISLEGTFKKIQGVSDPAFNNGARLTELTLAAGDGAILLRDM